MSKPLFQISLAGRLFAPTLIPTIAFLLLLPVLLRLGVWQLDRAEEKRQLIANLEAKSSEQSISLEQALQLDNPDQTKVTVAGQPVSDVYLVVDNQKHEGRLGYEVYALWQTESGSSGKLPKYILVSRGWLPRRDFYEKVPDIHKFTDNQLSGQLYFSKGSNQVVAQNAQWQKFDDAWLIGQFDLETLAEKAGEIGYYTAPFVVRQQADPGSPFVRQWELVASPPEKHIAYAVQWFGMALVLIILFIVLNLKRERQDESANG
ncbi:SURF1 family protein [Kangiella sp.]|uniref:SURF1 family protein n=1 Tax=Kangiella sp. TaxID=1920245 RepID=UPI003A8EBCBA